MFGKLRVVEAGVTFSANGVFYCSSIFREPEGHIRHYSGHYNRRVSQDTSTFLFNGNFMSY